MATPCTLICQKLLMIFYYYSRCFGTITYGISNQKNTNALQNPHRPTLGIYAYEQKYLMWFTIGQRLVCCGLVYYASFIMWMTEDAYFNGLTKLQLMSIQFCTISVAITQVWYSRRMVVAINELFRLIHSVRLLHPSYELFQWSHVLLLSVKVLCFIYEFGCMVEAVMRDTSLLEVVMTVGDIYLMIGVWLNLHIVCVLYICIEALYGAFNHYMITTFLHKLQEAQTFAHLSLPPLRVQQLLGELEKCSQIYQDIYRVGQELHNILQVPVVNTILIIYTGMISIVYYMIWKYFETNIFAWFYIPFMFKLTIDIVLVSLTAHKAIKSSHIIRRIGMENVVLSENKEWHRHMELFLYHINLNEFKLNILGLFEITNTLTLTFISGILTSLTIFIPFAIKSFRIQKMFAEN